MSDESEPNPAKEYETQMALSAVISEQVEIEDISLRRTSANTCAPVEWEGAVGSARVQFGTRASGSISADRKRIFALVRFRVEARSTSENPGSEKVLLEIDSEFRLSYKLKSSEGVLTEHVNAFAKMNSVFNAWPYWREYVSSTTVRMGLPPLIVKVFRVNNQVVRNNDDLDISEPTEIP